jgi:O-antigen/teichoic acid export membrane protein
MATIAQTVFKRADIVLVAALRSPAEAALYAAASRFVTVGLIGVQAIQQSLAPQLSAMFSRGQREQAQHVYQLATAWSIAIAWPIYLACAALAPLLLRFFGDGFAEAAPTVVVLNLAMLFAVAAGPVDTVLLMSGRSVLSLVNTAAAAIVDIVLCMLFVPRYGYAGAGWAWAVAMIVRNALPLLQVRRFLGMSPLGSVTIRVSGYAFGCFGVLPLGVALAGLPTWSIVATLTGCGLIFVALLWISRESLHLADLVGAFRKRRKSGATSSSGHAGSPTQ